MEMDAGEYSPGFYFEYYDVDLDDWTEAEEYNYAGFMDPDPGQCSVADYVYYGEEVTAFDDWDYATSDRVARCFGWASNNFPGTPQTITKAIEYWMD